MERIDYLLEQASEQSALDFEQRFIEVAAMLLEHPSLGVRRDELTPGLRAFVLGADMLLFYRVIPMPTEDVLEVVRVISGRRRLDGLF